MCMCRAAERMPAWCLKSLTMAERAYRSEPRLAVLIPINPFRDSKTPGFGQIPADAATVDAWCGVFFPGAAAAVTTFPDSITYCSGKSTTATLATRGPHAALVDEFLAVGDGAADSADAERMALDGIGHAGGPCGWSRVMRGCGFFIL